MVKRFLFICLAIFASPLTAQDLTPDADFDVRLELELDPRDTPPIEGEMVLATIRGFYRETITIEELKLRRMTDFDWIQLRPDHWYETSVDGLPTVVFERRIAIYPKRSGSVTILPIAHELELVNRAKERQFTLVRSEPVTLEVDPKPDGVGSDWLPATAIEISDSWSDDPAVLVDGQNVERRVVLRALGVPPELLPKQPPLREPWLITFTPPEERTVQLTSEGPVSTAVWVWYLRPITGAPGVIPPVEIPYFDTIERQAKTIAVPASPIGYASFANNASDGWQSGFAPDSKLWVGFFMGLLLAITAGLLGRRFSTGPVKNLRHWIDRKKQLINLKQLEKRNDRASFRDKLSHFLTRETKLTEAERLQFLAPLDAELFGQDHPKNPDAMRAALKDLSKLA